MKTSEILWQDTQHQRLIKILEKIEKDSVSLEIFDELKIYTREHFGMEEQYMDTYAFPGSESHKAAHRRFEYKLKELTRSKTILQKGLSDPDFKLQLVDFLRSWLMGHIFGIDKDLEAFLLQLENR